MSGRAETDRVMAQIEARAALAAERIQLATKAHNRTPAGLPLDEWNKIQNAKKRARRARKGK